MFTFYTDQDLTIEIVCMSLQGMCLMQYTVMNLILLDCIYLRLSGLVNLTAMVLIHIGLEQIEVCQS